MHPSELTPDLLSRCHRFAALLTGSSAAGADLLADVLQRCDGQMDQFRHERQGLAMLVARMREAVLKNRAPLLAGDGFAKNGQLTLLVAVAQLPEPKRSGLALLYTGLLPLPEIASLLGLSFDELCETFSQARTALDASWQDRSVMAAPLPEDEPETEASQP